mgnify:CR=1 FL=1
MARTKEFEPDDAVERAMQQFWSAGYAATTPQQLVDALHIGRSSLYNAFGSKQGLFEQALARYLDREAQRVVDALDQPGPPIERLGAAVRLVIHGADADPQRRGCLVTNTATESGARDGAVAALVNEAFRRQHAAFARTLAQGQAAGEVDPTRDAGELATYLLAVLNGAQVLSRARPTSDPIEYIADIAIRAIRA